MASEPKDSEMGSRSRSGETKVETKITQDSSNLTETPKFTLQNFPQPLSTKLDDLNFLIWRLQVVTIVNGYDLYNFLLGGKHIPSQFLSTEDELLNRPNPDYFNWKRQDQVLMSWMLMSMSDGMVSRMVRCRHSHDVWSTVATYFANQTQARHRQLSTQLRSTKKGSLSMSDYLLKLKKVVDALASIDQPITDRDYIETILHGLPSEYEGFITSFSLKDKEHTVIQVEAYLLAHEARLEAVKNDSSETISANLAQTQARNFSQNNRLQQSTFNNRGGFANRGNNRGRGRSRGGHGGRRTLCQNAPVEALLATPETLYDASWYPDSGASSHLTNDATNLQEQQAYTGPDTVHTANGNATGLSISTVGNSEVHTQNHKSLLLKDLYHVPSISKNLISVSKFSKDNNVYFQFFSDHFLVKSQETHDLLLKGRMTKGLYIFDSLPLKHKTNKAAFSANMATVNQSSSSSLNIWHSRLGHPAISSLPSTSIHDKDVAFQRLPSQNTPPQINDDSLNYPMVKDTTLSTSSTLQTRGQCPLPMVKDTTLSTSSTLQTHGQYPPPTPTQTYGPHPSPNPTSSLHPIILTSLPNPSTINSTPHTRDQQAEPTANTNLHPMTLGFRSAVCDNSLFIRRTQNSLLFILVYVDDVIVTGTSSTEVQQLLRHLHSQFSLKSLGSLHYFLGIEALATQDGSLLLSQSKYINDLLVRAGLENSTSQKTPMVSGLKLSSLGSEPCTDPSLYRSIVGALQYVTLTRPEISFCVNKLCQFMHNPQLTH
ncbi:Retrovirus-related Pol polyprotein from transposon TNT 1-94 [Senna tora]|uniref:Retrovirus-related Pol polyprotein from transposon TNT 1-94 n=1 Tax=Senna tora TaxID=362788 RepID=A0A834WRC4_9FABA|nr:Retrovirus-related Pol polyprotein from transposon TNT 1-94 [Senna tora]